MSTSDFNDLFERTDLPYHAGQEAIFGRDDFEPWPLPGPGAGRLIRTRGSVAEPLWWVRGREDLSDEENRWGQLLAELGMPWGERFMAALPNPDMTEAVLRGATAVGLRSVATSEYELPSVVEKVVPYGLVTTPMAAFRLLLLGALGPIKLLLLTADVSGMGRIQKRIQSLYPEMRVREIYAVSEYPGPLAVSCDAGQLHWASGDVIVDLLSPETFEPAVAGEIATVMVSDRTRRLWPLYRYDMEDWVRVSHGVCGCGRRQGRSSSPLLGRQALVRTVADRMIYPSDLGDLIFGVEGVSDRFEVSLFGDSGRGNHRMRIKMAPMEGMDGEEMTEELIGRAELLWGFSPEVELVAPSSLLPPLTMYYRQA